MPALITLQRYLPAAQALLKACQLDPHKAHRHSALGLDRTVEPTGIVSPGSATICCVALAKSLNLLGLFL